MNKPHTRNQQLRNHIHSYEKFKYSPYPHIRNIFGKILVNFPVKSVVLEMVRSEEFEVISATLDNHKRPKSLVITVR